MFITWRLFGSLPGKKDGPTWLRDPQIAALVMDDLLFGAQTRNLYRLDAWVIMPNHVHALLLPQADLSDALQWLKGRTARRANARLGRTGESFWMRECFDRWMRSDAEWEYYKNYIENNPVRAGLVRNASDWPWSSSGHVV